MNEYYMRTPGICTSSHTAYNNKETFFNIYKKLINQLLRTEITVYNIILNYIKIMTFIIEQAKKKNIT